MIKFNKILLNLFLISFGNALSAMDHGDICMSSFYYKNDVSEKIQGLNHKPFSDENKKKNLFVVRSVSAANDKKILFFIFI